MSTRDPAQRFRDIISNIDAIAASCAGLSKEQFLSDPDKYDATERRIGRISEAAVKLGEVAERLAPDQPWSEIRGIGNWLRHDYPNVLQDLIWQTIAEHLAPLRTDCEKALAILQDDSA